MVGFVLRDIWNGAPFYCEYGFNMVPMDEEMVEQASALE